MRKIKNYSVQFLEDDQKTPIGDLVVVRAESKKQAIREACRKAKKPYPTTHFCEIKEAKIIKKKEEKEEE